MRLENHARDSNSQIKSQKIEKSEQERKEVTFFTSSHRVASPAGSSFEFVVCEHD